MRAALYARVSTTDKGQNPEVQLRELREFCVRRGWANSCQYIDKGWSGAKDSRPELDRLWQDCYRRKCDVVVVYRFDRFARSMKQLVNALDEFRALGIQFVSLHENVDTTTPQGRLVFGIFAAIAEFERELIRERVRSGLANAREKGKHLGRPRCDPNVEIIRGRRAQGATWEEIARELGVSRATAVRAFVASQKPISDRVQ